jgi:hypothetical protein
MIQRLNLQLRMRLLIRMIQMQFSSDSGPLSQEHIYAGVDRPDN